MLISAAAAFIAIHLMVSGTRVREAIVRAIGERPYLGLFSAASLAIIVWLVMAYNAPQPSAGNRSLYDLGHVRDLGIPIVALAFLLGVQGLLIRNPTAVQQDTAVGKEGVVQGVLRITRHPFLWGVVLWSGFHLLANGDLASVIFFGTFLVVALPGTCSIDAKLRRRLVRPGRRLPPKPQTSRSLRCLPGAIRSTSAKASAGAFGSRFFSSSLCCSPIRASLACRHFRDHTKLRGWIHSNEFLNEGTPCIARVSMAC
jgi:uncharacterized membrane protein